MSRHELASIFALGSLYKAFGNPFSATRDHRTVTEKRDQH